MHHANQAIKAYFRIILLCTLLSGIIIWLSKKAEGWQARMTVLEKEKKNAQAIHSARRSLKSGKRLSLEGKHLISMEEGS